jgi:hypothetical protein
MNQLVVEKLAGQIQFKGIVSQMSHGRIGCQEK